MARYRKKPVVIEAITFEEFIEYGKAHTDHLVNSMPWHFEYNGYPVTHANDECYIIPTLEGEYSFTPKDMLITGVKGEIYPCKKDIFEATYETLETLATHVVEVVKCKDCIYFQPDFVMTPDGKRRPYTEEEIKKGKMVTGDVGINCGSRCERFGYWEKNKFPVWYRENDYCSYGERRE